VGDSYTHTHMNVRCMAGVVVESGMRVCVYVCGCMWVGGWVGGCGWGGTTGKEDGGNSSLSCTHPQNENACSASIRCRTESTCMGRTILPTTISTGIFHRGDRLPLYLRLARRAFPKRSTSVNSFPPRQRLLFRIQVDLVNSSLHAVQMVLLTEIRPLERFGANTGPGESDQVGGLLRKCGGIVVQ
jgi:hypothetical protein